MSETNTTTTGTSINVEDIAKQLKINANERKELQKKLLDSVKHGAFFKHNSGHSTMCIVKLPFSKTLGAFTINDYHANFNNLNFSDLTTNYKPITEKEYAEANVRFGSIVDGVFIHRRQQEQDEDDDL